MGHIKKYSDFINEGLRDQFNILILRTVVPVLGFEIPKPLVIFLSDFIDNVHIKSFLKYEVTLLTVIISIFIAKFKEMTNKMLSLFSNIFNISPPESEIEDWKTIFQKLCKSKIFIDTIKSVNTLNKINKVTYHTIENVIEKVLNPDEVQKLLKMKNNFNKEN